MTMSLIETVTVGSGGTSSIEFTSIPQDGTDLVLVFSVRAAEALAVSGLWLRVNSDTGSNYTWRRLRGDGSTADSASTTTTRFSFVAPGSTATSNTFGNGQAYFPNYTGATNKSVSLDFVSENNATTANQEIHAGTWADTSALTTVSLVAPSTTFVEHSTASLYKITKGSDGIVTTS